MKEKFKLIEGVFSAKDAKEILLTFIEEKIKFHELKSFSAEVKTGHKSEEALIRVEELKKTRRELVELLESENTESIYLSSYVEVKKVAESPQVY
nr:hypothetical protein [uncultured Pedobacter sp.]